MSASSFAKKFSRTENLQFCRLDTRGIKIREVSIEGSQVVGFTRNALNPSRRENRSHRTYDNLHLHLHLPEPCKNSSKFAIKETISSGGGEGGVDGRGHKERRSLPDIALVTRFRQLFIFISAGCEAAQRNERFFQDGSRSSSRDQTDRTRKERKKEKKKKKEERRREK